MATESSTNSCAQQLTNERLKSLPKPNPTTKHHAASKHSTKYRLMYYVSREIRIRQCYCIAFTTFRCRRPRAY